MPGDAGKMDAQDRFQRIKLNNDRLNSCQRHEFPNAIPGIENGVASMFGQKIKCIRCDGEADLLYVNAYIRGYEASGKSGNDIMRGWRDAEPKRRFFKPDTD